ncbi:MAG: class I SAM-dependent methyltransferase [Ginsengibacter sp.]
MSSLTKPIKETIKKIVPYAIIKKYKNYQEHKMLDLYKGDKVFCPICGSSFETFGPYGVVKRQNAQCIKCGSLERHRLLFLYLNSETNLFDSKTKIRVLHFAPEKSFYDIFSQQQNIEYVPCDLFPEGYSYGKVKAIKVDITKIPFEDSYFDAILCNHVLEHVPDDILAMKELKRVMKNDGWGVFQIPIDYNREKTYEDFTLTTEKQRKEAFGQKDHVRWYGRDYTDRLKSAGFNVTEDDYVKKFSSEEIYKMRLTSSELIYYCTK